MNSRPEAREKAAAAQCGAGRVDLSADGAEAMKR